MSYRDSHDANRSLHAVAATQGGYFTAKQAAAAGYDYPHLSYHLHAGSFERAGHGLYRIVTIPSAEQDQFIRLALWSRDRQDMPQAVVSHDTALALHDLSDVLPRRIHLTVPPSFRKAVPSGCVLHRAMLTDSDIEQRGGYGVTSPLRTILDVARESTVTDEQLGKAIQEAMDRGMVRKSKLVAAAEKGAPRASRILCHLAKRVAAHAP
jgi:predicted transcriptional regulator of viral defense system